jgi:hypothetical protein
MGSLSSPVRLTAHMLRFKASLRVLLCFLRVRLCKHLSEELKGFKPFACHFILGIKSGWCVDERSYVDGTRWRARRSSGPWRGRQQDFERGGASARPGGGEESSWLGGDDAEDARPGRSLWRIVQPLARHEHGGATLGRASVEVGDQGRPDLGLHETDWAFRVWSSTAETWSGCTPVWMALPLAEEMGGCSALSALEVEWLHFSQ